jgi:hypothetical protein
VPRFVSLRCRHVALVRRRIDEESLAFQFPKSPQDIRKGGVIVFRWYMDPYHGRAGSRVSVYGFEASSSRFLNTEPVAECWFPWRI